MRQHLFKLRVSDSYLFQIFSLYSLYSLTVSTVTTVSTVSTISTISTISTGSTVSNVSTVSTVTINTVNIELNCEIFHNYFTLYQKYLTESKYEIFQDSSLVKVISTSSTSRMSSTSKMSSTSSMSIMNSLRQVPRPTSTRSQAGNLSRTVSAVSTVSTVHYRLSNEN